MNVRGLVMLPLYAYAAALLLLFAASACAVIIDLFLEGMPASAALDGYVRWWKH